MLLQQQTRQAAYPMNTCPCFLTDRIQVSITMAASPARVHLLTSPAATQAQLHNGFWPTRGKLKCCVQFPEKLLKGNSLPSSPVTALLNQGHDSQNSISGRETTSRTEASQYTWWNRKTGIWGFLMLAGTPAAWVPTSGLHL